MMIDYRLLTNYTPQLMFLLAFSFANFENWGVSFPSTPSGRFKICKWKKQGETFFGECICNGFQGISSQPGPVAKWGFRNWS